MSDHDPHPTGARPHSARAVRFEVSAETAFDYLVDPANRAAWQSSLARVSDVDGEIGVGQSWTDVTKPGLRPRMETTELDRPRRWTEHGVWRGVLAELTLTFEPVAGSDGACEVTATMRLGGGGLAGLLVRPVGLVAPLAVRGDLKRAAAILADR